VHPLLQWKDNGYYTVFVYICSLRYPACNAHASFPRLWPAALYNVFPHYLIKDTIFQQQVLNIKCVFGVSLYLLSQTFLILRITERSRSKIFICLHVKHPLFYLIIMKL